jgi:VIT1/CCC1 family predicted Fe2+/Mn2+ transporter
MGVHPAPEPLLDPISRAGEIIFGLIMVLTFTNSLSVAEAGRADVRAMLVAALGCNLAWGIIDAVMYLMATRAERRIEAKSLAAILDEHDAARARNAIASLVPRPIAEALGDDGLEQIRSRLELSPEAGRTELSLRDYAAGGRVFILVFACTFPVVLPFLALSDVQLALAASNTVGIISLFLAGYGLGRASDQALRTGLTTVGVGIVLVGVARALGG